MCSKSYNLQFLHDVILHSLLAAYTYVAQGFAQHFGECFTLVDFVMKMSFGGGEGGLMLISIRLTVFALLGYDPDAL